MEISPETLCGVVCKADSSKLCGDIEIRTLDPLLAKQVLYQLSYTPEA